MIGISDSSVAIQVSLQFVPSTPAWFGEMALIAHYLKRQGVLAALEEQVHFARRRFGHYEMIDFVAVLLSYAISGERTHEAFYERLQRFSPPQFDCFPARSEPIGVSPGKIVWHAMPCAGYLGYPFHKMRRRGRYQILYRSISTSGRWRYSCSRCCILLCFRTDTLSSSYKPAHQARGGLSLSANLEVLLD